MQSFKILAAALGFMASALPAFAASSEWSDAEGGRVRLVTAGKPDAAGQIRGALEIDLNPGWKTYWRDPGSSGVPPQFDISRSTNISGAELSFPAPRRHDDGYGKWAGYDRSISLPVVFKLASPGATTAIDADIFLGICETICVPVQASLKLDPAADPDNADDTALVDAGFAALPEPQRADFGVKPLPGDPETLVVEASAPGDSQAVDFFIAGASDYMFGTPVRGIEGGKITFKVPILDRPTSKPTGSGLHYTLTSADGAVQGLVPYP
ncbi:MAG TPA: protein-disulfide reductase DsbD domain-containing protein [Mesorhizobium sp.]